MNQTKKIQPKQAIGEMVSEFRLPDLDGGTKNLSSFLDGKKGAVVVFWSETCSHCQRYDKYLNEFTASRPDVALVAVASRQGENPERIRASVEERQLRFPILYDAQGVTARQWFTQQTPRAFLVDSQLRLLYR